MNDYELLGFMRDEIQAEHALLSHRMSWYAASQSFLMTAYSIAWGAGHENAWEAFFKHGMPSLGILLSICAFLGICAAVEVQNHIIRRQGDLLKKMLEDSKDDKVLLQRLEHYEGITCGGRKAKKSAHWMAMIPPCVVPVIFSSAWGIAWYLSEFNPPA